MKFPSPNAVLDARNWLLAGAPAASKEHDAKESVKTLISIMKILPTLDPRYAWGTPEWKKAMEENEIPE